jgi:Mn-dependent DtxR family transcriptional regulator
MTENTDQPGGRTRAWTFLTNHAHVLICIQEDCSIRTRNIAERVGITERAVQHIISDLSAAGYLTRTREGRRNRYEVHADRPLRHPVEAHCLLSSLLKTVDRSHQARAR